MNEINDKGAKVLESAITNNLGVTELCMDDNSIDGTIVFNIAKEARYNHEIHAAPLTKETFLQGFLSKEDTHLKSFLSAKYFDSHLLSFCIFPLARDNNAQLKEERLRKPTLEANQSRSIS